MSLRVATLLCLCACLALPLAAQPDPAKADPAKPAGPIKPDLTLRSVNTDTVTGANVFNTTGNYNGDGQRLQTVMPNGTATAFMLMVTNPADAPQTEFLLKVSRPAEGWSLFAAQPYMFGDERDISNLLTGDGVKFQLSARGNYVIGILLKAPAKISACTLGINLITTADRRDIDYAEIALTSADIPRPPVDLSVKAATSPTYKGTDLFIKAADNRMRDNNQRVTQMLPFNALATFHVKVTNTTDLTQTFRLAIPTRQPMFDYYKGITVTIYDAAKDGMVVTDRYGTPEGGVGTLKPGASQVFRVEIDNQSNRNQTMYLEIPISLLNAETREVSDTAQVAANYMGPGAQPDLMAKRARDAAYTGEGAWLEPFRYDAAGLPKLEVSCPFNTRTVVQMRLRNTSRKTTDFRLQIPGIRMNAFAVPIRCYDSARGGADITDAVSDGTYSTPELAPNAVFDFRLEVTVTQKGQVIQPLSVSVTAPNGLLGRDGLTLALTATNEAPPPAATKPDLMVKRPQDTKYSNADVYAATGDDTVPAINVALPVGKRFAVDVRVKNNGAEPAAFKIGPCVKRDGWETHYFEGDTEITDKVKAGAWDTGDLEPGAAKDLRLELVAGDALGADNVIELPLTVLPVDANATGMDIILFKVTRVAK
jgi:hypothetical protein